MTDPRLDAKLKAFLDDAERDRAEGNTVANVLLELHQVKIDVNELRTEHKLLKHRVDRHGQSIAQIKQRIELEPLETDTGTFQVEELRRELAKREAELQERKEDAVWWKRSAVKWIVGGIAWIFTTFVAALIANIFHGRK